MKIIAHRRNSVAELQATPTRFGVEVDIRSQGNTLVIHHDPFQFGEPFEVWLSHFKHSTLILNVKEEGIEARLIELMRAHGIKDYFFLDQSFPFLVKFASLGEHRGAIRVSEFESIETALRLSGKVDWVWVDCFSKFPLTRVEARLLKAASFKLCLVSPELQGRGSTEHILEFIQQIAREEICPEAVCTRRPDIWEGATIL